MNPSVVFSKPFRTRSKMSGTVTLAALGADAYSGQDAREDRFCLIVTNLEASGGNSLKWRKASGGKAIGGTIFPASNIILILSEDIEIYNPNAGASVNYEVTEEFYDPGAYSGQTEQQFSAGSPASGGSNGGTSGGGSYGGGGGGTYYGGGSSHPGTATKVN